MEKQEIMEICRVGNSKVLDFKAGKKLIMRKRERLQGWKGVELMTVVEWYVSGARDLKFIGREFHQRGWGYRMIDLQT